MYTTTTRNPIVKTEMLTLCDYVDVGGVRQLIPFEREVLWLRESESTLSLTHGGKLVKELQTLCDSYYRLYSNFKSTLEDIPDYQESYGIIRASTLILEMRVKVKDTPVVFKRESSISGCIDYERLPDWHYYDEALLKERSQHEVHSQEWLDVHERIPSLGERVMLEKLVWTSKELTIPSGEAVKAEVSGLLS